MEKSSVRYREFVRITMAAKRNYIDLSYANDDYRNFSWVNSNLSMLSCYSLHYKIAKLCLINKRRSIPSRIILLRELVLRYNIPDELELEIGRYMRKDYEFLRINCNNGTLKHLGKAEFFNKKQLSDPKEIGLSF